jgi:hypothetical protein
MDEQENSKIFQVEGTTGENRQFHQEISKSPVTLDRLADQIAWYDKKSRAARYRYKAIKLLQIIVAAIVPLVTVFDFPSPGKITALLGLSMLIMEGIQQLGQYQENWITYRSTCEALKHEKYAFLADAGPYAATSAPIPILADRIEGLISQEHAKWISTMSRAKASEGASHKD